MNIIAQLSQEEMLNAYNVATEIYSNNKSANSPHIQCIIALHDLFGVKAKVEAAYMRFVALNSLIFAYPEKFSGRIIANETAGNTWIDGYVFTIASALPIERGCQGFDSELFFCELKKFPLKDMVDIQKECQMTAE